MATQPDPAATKAEQRANWDAASPGWAIAEVDFERGAATVTQQLLDLAGVRTGHRVLDVATGHGEPALSAAEVVGPKGRVVGTDVSPAMLDVARQRARGLDHVAFLTADLEELPKLVSERFDAVLSRFGLMFAVDHAALFSDLRDLLAPGGVLAAAVWAAQDEHLLSVGSLTLSERLGLPQAGPGAPDAFGMADQERLAADVVSAGFGEVSVSEHVVPFRFADVPAYLRFTKHALPPSMMHTAREQLGYDDVEIDAVMSDAATAHVDAEGRLALPSIALLLRATSPTPGHPGAVGSGTPC